MLLIMSPEEGVISLRAAARTPQAESVAWRAIDADMLEVTMRVPVLRWAAEVPAAFTEESRPLLMGINADYLASAIRALALVTDEQVRCGTDGPLRPLRTQPVGRDEVLVFTMPMQLPTG